ncbi:MAG: hypothetical protein UY21_C0001G0100 [Microgenomates group bacterium GW2011_GWA1_48_10]|nr:MAG: hypothetical protein UY21_C0001G0100 [Microgenomates group bacterium GW2011_GWA1_48_10]
MPTESVEERTKTTTTSEPSWDGDSSSDTIRKIVAAVIGIIIIILLVLLAKWVGDKIRERFLTPKTPTATTQEIPPEDSTPVSTPSGTTYPPSGQPPYTTIPATGPEDWAYVFLALLALTGFSSLLFARKLSSS